MGVTYMSQHVAPYGSWKSPITSDMVATGVMRLGQVEVEGNDVYWCESRPSEAGRYVIVKHSSEGETVDVTPPPFNARTRVHEYGGGAYKVNQGTVYFTHFDDQRLYKMQPGDEPTPITPAIDVRYADFAFDTRRGRLICVREDHRDPRPEAVNTLVSMDLDGQDAQIILSGNDFYSSPRISPDGRHLAWITWNHPHMPWDHTELWVGRLRGDGRVDEPLQVAGALAASVVQPVWSPSGSLYFVSDRSNWWNLYCWREGEVTSVYPYDGEFAVPHWVFAQANYACESERRIVCSYTQKGAWHLARLHVETGAFAVIPTPYTDIASLRVAPGFAVFLGGSPQDVPAIVQLDLHTGRVKVLQRSSGLAVDGAYLSTPTPIEFPSEQGLTAHAIYYPPRNTDYGAPPGTRPPLLVFTHGGPTSAASTTLSWALQYWTSRGIAVVDVNYGGSSGYGRAYRQRLTGQWGVVDIDDCVNAAKYLVAVGAVDGAKLAIRGGSAGGYTTINALTFRDVFKAGASYYGISDLEVFVHDTHKFESRYLDSLIGPYPTRRDLYHARSAIHFLDRIRVPLILFQGLEDRVVPPNQAELIVEALRQSGRPVAYLPFEGEQHGFRRAETVKRSLEAEFYFYSRIFGFEPADSLEPVRIENL